MPASPTSQRVPLSTLSLTPFIPLDSLPTRSPRKSSSRPMTSPLRSSSTSRSTTPQRLSSTANGPLSTLYEAPLVALQPSPRPSPARQMLDHDQRQIGPDDDDEGALDATPPRRLLDLFLQSASKPQSNGSLSNGRASPAPPAVRPPRNDKDELPTWTFYEDSPSLDASLPSSTDASTGGAQVVQEDTEMLSPDSPPPTNENAPPPPLPRRSRSANSFAPPAPNGSGLSASPRSRSTTAPLPPPITLPPSQPPATADTNSPPSTPPPLFPSWTETTSAFPTLSPSLNSSTSQSFFGDTGTSSFEMDGQSRASSLLPGFVAAFSSPRRSGGKRESLESEGEGEEEKERKRLRMSVEGNDELGGSRREERREGEGKSAGLA